MEGIAGDPDDHLQGESLPEFLMDPLSFGGDGTGGRINVSYDYFSKPGNKDKLEAIMSGETVKLKVRDLAPDKDCLESYVYCYRRVYPDFEVVKLAYNIDDLNSHNLRQSRRLGL